MGISSYFYPKKYKKLQKNENFTKSNFLKITLKKHKKHKKSQKTGFLGMSIWCRSSGPQKTQKIDFFRKISVFFEIFDKKHDFSVTQFLIIFLIKIASEGGHRVHMGFFKLFLL